MSKEACIEGVSVKVVSVEPESGVQQGLLGLSRLSIKVIAVVYKCLKEYSRKSRKNHLGNNLGNEEKRKKKVGAMGICVTVTWVVYRFSLDMWGLLSNKFIGSYITDCMY